MNTQTKITTSVFSLLTILMIGSNLFVAPNSQNAKAYTITSSQTSAFTNKTLSVNLTDVAKEIAQEKNIKREGTNRYEYVGQNNDILVLSPGQSKSLWLDLKNTGDTTWEKSTFHLGTSHPKDRTSVFANANWFSPNRIAMDQDQDTIDNGGIARFQFTIIAPQTSGIYYEYFRPVIDGREWLNDIGIYWKITVKNANEDEATLPVFNKSGTKKIVVSISRQNLTCIEDGDAVCDMPISSGTYTTPTPIGNFKVERKAPVAYSPAYDLYMNYWMAFTPNGAYGLHELPYWKYYWGIITEGANHLGIRVSHGCVRMGIGSAKMVYDWAPVGTPVEIVN